MACLNKVFLIGYLGGDPETRTTQGGKAVCSFSLATSRGSADTATTEWHKVIVWERLAELANKFLRKGDQVHVEGRIQSRDWTDKEGVKRTVVEIIAQELTFLRKVDRDGAREPETHRAAPSRAPAQPTQRPTQRPQESVPFDEDIPF